MRDKIIALAREAGNVTDFIPYLERFYQLAVAEEREKVAKWMMQRALATGHGDTIEDLLNELEWQVREKEREECAKIADDFAGDPCDVAAEIRARKP